MRNLNELSIEEMKSAMLEGAKGSTSESVASSMAKNFGDRGYAKNIEFSWSIDERLESELSAVEFEDYENEFDSLFYAEK